jgi:hypothetical protein
MDGRMRIGDHTFDEDTGFESDQLQDDAAENRPPEPLDPMPPPPPGMNDDEDVQA